MGLAWMQQRLLPAMTLILHGMLVAHVGIACMPICAHGLHVPAIVVGGAVPIGPKLHLLRRRQSIYIRMVTPMPDRYRSIAQNSSKLWQGSAHLVGGWAASIAAAHNATAAHAIAWPALAAEAHHVHAPAALWRLKSVPEKPML